MSVYIKEALFGTLNRVEQSVATTMSSFISKSDRPRTKPSPKVGFQLQVVGVSTFQRGRPLSRCWCSNQTCWSFSWSRNMMDQDTAGTSETGWPSTTAVMPRAMGNFVGLSGQMTVARILDLNPTTHDYRSGFEKLDQGGILHGA